MTQDYVTTGGGVDTDLFRHVAGHLASGVTVVTTRADGRDYGMTASSVTSLSMEPPMMLACINNAVPTAAAIERSGRYTVNVLGQSHADLAHQFAAPRPDKFAGVSVERGIADVVILTDAIAALECEVTEQVTGGTHSVFFGFVVSATARDGAPLTYFRGGFGRFEFERNDNAYARARDMVLSRVFTAEQVVTVDELADRLEGDRAQAFYALTRLAAEGLVLRDPQRGYVIAPFDIKTSDYTFEARLAIELGVIDCVGDHADPAQLAIARHHLETMSRHLVGDRFEDFHAYLDANYAFHEAIVALTGNPLLIAAFGSLSIKNVMMRSFGNTAQSSTAFLAAQRDLLEALERGDTVGAREAARSYCALAKARTRQLLSLTGGLF
ncbi:flavin reductase [Mycolicibacterium smegmatis]|uniref:flavin reductase n=1 Tax=Mycolicibacterium smegmatis TaxID=1772 RepID=UPI001E2F96EE|nr:flavin reductase [Mycolicibacterium smegmatis]UGU33512.1 flavin reductase [Mycolicibacterium smegmatis]ULN33311.1 flavin reductase [Mycolicibacterium smegmatis]ULN68376.1 flavin reductase [Mycolicibacterium smegmatis]